MVKPSDMTADAGSGQPVATSAAVALPDAPAPAPLPSSMELVAAHAPGFELPTHPGVQLAPPGVVPESDVRTHAPGAAGSSPLPPPAAAESLGELPLGYGDGRLVCLVRDPSTLFVYWDLSQQQIEQAFQHLGEARAVLKLLSLRGELVREQEIHLEARGWYVRGLPHAAELRVELWAFGERGARLLRASRPLRLPAAQPSDDLDARYATVQLDAPLPKDLLPGPARTFLPEERIDWSQRPELVHLEEERAQEQRDVAAWGAHGSGEGQLQGGPAGGAGAAPWDARGSGRGR